MVTNFVYLLAYILSCKRGLARSLKSFYAFEWHEFRFSFSTVFQAKYMTFSKRSRTQFCFPFLGLFPRFFLLSCAIDTPKSRWKRRKELGVHLSKFGRKENCTQESSEKLQAPGENQIHDPPSSSSCALAIEPLEAICPPGSKFNFNYIEITQKLEKK